MSGDYQYNQYFEQNSFFNSQSLQARNANFFFSDNSEMMGFKEHISIGNSYHNDLFDCQSFEKLQPTRLPTKINQIQQVEPLYFSLQIETDIVFEEDSFYSYKKAYQGTKDDTVELNINFKTMLANYFKELIVAKELNEVEIQHVTEFMNRGPSFNSLKELFKDEPENKEIRRNCMIFFTSTECIKRVMSSRCKMKTKLQMIKFMEKVRLNILCPDVIIKWKDVVKREIIRSA